MARKI